MNTIHGRRRPAWPPSCGAALAALTLAATGASGSRRRLRGRGPARLCRPATGRPRVTAGSIDGFWAFRYAAPPPATWRRRPQPPASGRGSATPPSSGRAARSSPQGNATFPPGPISEDCLDLNVYTPGAVGNDMGNGGQGVAVLHGSTAAGQRWTPAATTTRPSWQPTASWPSPSTTGSARSASLPTRHWRRGPAARPATTADGPAGRTALGPGQIRHFGWRLGNVRSPASRPVACRCWPTWSPPASWAVPEGDHRERVLRAQPAAPGHR